MKLSGKEFLPFTVGIGSSLKGVPRALAIFRGERLFVQCIKRSMEYRYGLLSYKKRELTYTYMLSRAGRGKHLKTWLLRLPLVFLLIYYQHIY